MEKEKNYIIYSYEIGNHVYVGLTKDMKRRDKEHRGIAYKKKDSLKNFIVENHNEMPQPKILESNLSETEAISKEDNWLRFYKDNGYKIINKGSTGLHHGSPGNTLFEKKEKPERNTKMSEILAKIKDSTLTDDEAISCFWRFSTKTQMSKECGLLYSFCRERGLLDRFPKKKKPAKMKMVFDGAVECDETSLLGIPKTTGFFIDPGKGLVVRKYKKHCKKVSFNTDDDGYFKCTVMFGQQVKEAYYHNILASCLGIVDGFVVSYKNEDHSDIATENIQFEKITGNTAYTFDPHVVVTQEGTLINRKRNTVIIPERTEDGLYFNGIEVGSIVYNYFKKHIDLKYDEVVHLDGDVFNNNIENLFFQGDDIIKMEIDTDGKYVISVLNGCGRIHVGTFTNKRFARDAHEVLVKKLASNPYWPQWIDEMKTNVISPLIEKDREKTKYEMRVESSGCYWFEPRKCWKSKIYHAGKEWSLGYFNSFESGKLMYELASLYIKYGKFERWIKDVEYERRYVE